MHCPSKTRFRSQRAHCFVHTGQQKVDQYSMQCLSSRTLSYPPLDHFKSGGHQLTSEQMPALISDGISCQTPKLNYQCLTVQFFNANSMG